MKNLKHGVIPQTTCLPHTAWLGWVRAAQQQQSSESRLIIHVVLIPIYRNPSWKVENVTRKGRNPEHRDYAVYTNIGITLGCGQGGRMTLPPVVVLHKKIYFWLLNWRGVNKKLGGSGKRVCVRVLTLNTLTWRIRWAPNNASICYTGPQRPPNTL